MKTVSELTLEQKVGQVMLVGFLGTEPDDHICEMIEKYQVGNILLFTRNLDMPQQVIKMNNALQDMAMRSSGIPLAISTDQEGGVTSRMINETTLLPGNMALGAIGDEAVAYQHAAIQAKELLAMGINQNLGPVLDVNMVVRSPIIGPRAFSDLPEECARLGAAVVRGLQENGVNATIKHFPGQGAIDADTHIDAPLLDLSHDELMQRELLPFKAAMDAGAASMMTAHIKLAAYDKELPATLSKAVMTDLLRGELDFQGVAMTDGLEMHAITKYFPIGEAGVKALEAGCDLLMVCHTRDEQVQVREAVLKAVQDGKLSIERLDEAVGRVLRMKERLWDEKLRRADNQRAAEVIGRPKHIEDCRDICRSAVTVLRNDAGLLPLKLKKDDKVMVACSLALDGIGSWDTQKDKLTILGEAFCKRHANVLALPVHPITDERMIAELKEQAQGVSLIVAATVSGHNIWGGVPNPLTVFSQQEEFVRGLIETGIPLVMISARDPYDVMDLPEAKTVVAAYNWWRPTMDAVVEILFGDVKPSGKLPVEIPGAFARGHGLSY